MSDIAIRVEGLSKRYSIGKRQASYSTLRDTIMDALHSPLRRAGKLLRRDRAASGEPDDSIWALKDVSFKVDHGEIVGIIGRNGAGKSTLLKIMSRITEPTTGRAEIHGRVGSLLEVGTGFHPELTGRENVYLNGAILGMKRAEIERKFDEIVAFAEVEKFIDTPVKHYSSGMYLRLAFAVAAHLETEVLFVDEVLAVGDVTFQNKCLGKMGAVAKEGRTVILVSHNLQAISTLAKRVLVLDSGRLVFDGDTYSALGHYRNLTSNNGAAIFCDQAKTLGVILARVITSEPNQIHICGKPLTFEFEALFREKPMSGFFSFQVVDESMRPIMHLWLSGTGQSWSRKGKVFLRCVVPKARLYMGRYTIRTHLSDCATKEQYETVDGICPFEVVMDGIPREYEWWRETCTFLEDAKWTAT